MSNPLLQKMTIAFSFYTVVCNSALAQGQATTDKSSDANAARLQEQANQLQNTKMREAHRKIQANTQVMHKKKKEIDQHLQHQHRQLDHHVDGMWHAAVDDAHLQKQQLTRQAAAQKQKIMEQHHDDTMRQVSAAKRSVDSVHQSVAGLQSQTSKDGRFGLKPQSSNLHVRHYGGK